VNYFEIVSLEKHDIQVANEIDCRTFDSVDAKSLTEANVAVFGCCSSYIDIDLRLYSRVTLSTYSEHLHMSAGLTKRPIDEFSFVRRSGRFCDRQHVRGFQQVAFTVAVLTLEQR
jgi:hypothetical protein